MQAFNNDPNLKAGLLREVQKHRLADQIVKGSYGEFEDGKFLGCAVGCSIHSYNLLTGQTLRTSEHKVYEQFGIPRMLARIEDGIFEELPEQECILWPERFFNAIRVGADLSSVWPQFTQWLLTDPEHGVIKYARTDEQRVVIQRVSDLYAMGAKATREARYAAACAVDAAYVVDARQKARIAKAEKLIELLKAA